MDHCILSIHIRS